MNNKLGSKRFDYYKTAYCDTLTVVVRADMFQLIHKTHVQIILMNTFLRFARVTYQVRSIHFASNSTDNRWHRIFPAHNWHRQKYCAVCQVCHCAGLFQHQSLIRK